MPEIRETRSLKAARLDKSNTDIVLEAWRHMFAVMQGFEKPFNSSSWPGAETVRLCINDKINFNTTLDPDFELYSQIEPPYGSIMIACQNYNVASQMEALLELQEMTDKAEYTIQYDSGMVPSLDGRELHPAYLELEVKQTEFWNRSVLNPMLHYERQWCGLPMIVDAAGKKATMGGLLKIGNRKYALTVGHVLQGPNNEMGLRDWLRRAETRHGLPSTASSLTLPVIINSSDSECGSSTRVRSCYSSLNTSDMVGLITDFGLIEIDLNAPVARASISEAQQFVPSSFVVDIPKQADVWILTATYGLLIGKFVAKPSIMNLPGRTAMQQFYPVFSEYIVRHGKSQFLQPYFVFLFFQFPKIHFLLASIDANYQTLALKKIGYDVAGSWVIDQTTLEVYGHVVCPQWNRYHLYITLIKDIAEDIKGYIGDVEFGF
jgi:hypothetical protein